MHIFGQIYESLLFAFRALKANILRTILSLLSVTVGIFLIIAVRRFSRKQHQTKFLLRRL
jgi:putative ABC transport system permease protein